MPISGLNKRYNIIDLKNNHCEKFGRFIMALKNLINSDDWARICGIHGNTFKPHDSGVLCPIDKDTVTRIGETGEPFYCKHGVYSFIAWHTPYLYQFELLLNKYSTSSNNDYITLPFLDLTDFDADFSFLNDPEITIFFDKKQITVENPLACAYYYVNEVRVRTSRSGFFTACNAKQRSQLETVKKQLNNALYASNYERFSSLPTKKVRTGTVDDYVPLETPHNSLHNIIGGKSGNMSNVDVAAFDPVFWLHHSNMDRHYYTWMHQKTEGFKKPLIPQFITKGTYDSSCAPFFSSYIYSQDWRLYKWGWLNDTDKYMKVGDTLALNHFPYTYDLIKLEPVVPLTSYVELIDIPIPRETVEFNVYIHSTKETLNKVRHFAGSAVWFGVNRDTVECHRCNIGRTNVKIDIQAYVKTHGITDANIDNFVLVLEGEGSLIKSDTASYQLYNMADLIKDGSYTIVL